MTVLTILASIAAAIGPLALAGGPVGLGVAWLGSLAANKTVKLITIIGGLLLLVGTAVAITVHWQHLERDSAAYKTLSAAHASLEQLYGCPSRPAHERDLAACLTARDRDAEAAIAREIKRQRDHAAAEQARLDREAAEQEAERQASGRAIDLDAANGDGPVPPVLLNAWRRARGIGGAK